MNDSEKSPSMAMLKPQFCLSGSIPENSRSGSLQEMDIMMTLKGVKENYLALTSSATQIKLTAEGQKFFGMQHQNRTPIGLDKKENMFT